METRPHTQTQRKSTGGFTLLELMAAVTVLGVLLAIGIPSFTETTRDNRLTSVTNSFVTALNIARSEAAKQGIAVSVCAADDPNNPTTCSGADTWANGWIVFTDDTGTAGTLDAPSDKSVQVFAPPPQGFAIAPDTSTTTKLNDAAHTALACGATPSPLGYIRFLPRGTLDTTALLTCVKLTRPSCTGYLAREVTVGRTGRISTNKVSC